MDINKKNRSDLKSYFVKNSIPTESNFAELIDGMLNQKDDGIVKLSGDPLSIEAAGDPAGLQKVINFYAKFQDANPSWSLQLNPRTDPNTPATAKAGFCVADGSGAARLFIDQNTGNIGVGVVNPSAKLDVAGQVRIGLDEGGSGVRSISFARDAGDEGNAGKISYRGGFGQDALHIVGAGAANNARKIKLWDNTEVTNLTALGVITPSAGNSESNGILFPKNAGGGAGDSAWLRYYARAGESMTLELGTYNDADDHIALMPSGNVGIGLNNPLYSLDVKASKGIKLGLEGAGGGQLILKNNKDDNKIYVEAFSKDGTASAAELLLTGINGASVPKLSLVADVTNITGNAGIGLAGTAAPIAKLDIAQTARSGAHPTAVKGLYITGDFGPDADGIELRNSNATQGIGFGYNTIYAAGSIADQNLQLKPKGAGVMRVLGAANISNGSDVANANKYMSSGSLTIGGTNASFGGGANWNANTAGLLLETLANTEIAVHDASTRVASLMYYQGDAVNKITIGRDMGWGLTPVTIAGDITLNGNVALGGFTGADADEWPKFTWYRDTANNWDEGLIKHASSRGFFGRTGYGIHVNSSRDWTFFSSGWDALLGIEGGTGNTKVKGKLTVNSAITPSAGNSENNGIMFPKDPAGGGGDAAWLRYYARAGESMTLELGTSNDADDHIALIPSGNVGIGTINPTKAKLEIQGSSTYTMPLFDYLTLYNSVQRGTVGPYPLSLYASNMIAASHFLAFSDERVKNIQGLSDSATDLQTLLGIEITDYHYKDVIGKGNSPHKKVIAQQVERIFSQAVSKHTDVVPDIYQQASFIDGWVELATDLKEGERVRLISGKAEGIYEVLEVVKGKFRTGFRPEEDNVFVFGREVNDFCNVDYDAIAMLNVSATQQIKKEMDAVVIALKAENAALKARLDALEAKIH
ncbi:tail fiber domain-containing protein [Methylobacter sp.]|uniref:tail fiber domain-containing protein n=1 Tax=Methylobacter sp. TaxID=2051955 RepID=UPI002FDDA2A3